MSLSNTAKAKRRAASSGRMCYTAGQTGSDTSDRLERISLVQAIVAEGDQLERWPEPASAYWLNSLHHVTREELLLLADKYGFDGTDYTDRGIVAELITRQDCERVIREEAREHRVRQAHERIQRYAERLRELLPEGMLLGDYLNAHKCLTYTRRERKRPAYRY